MERNRIVGKKTEDCGRYRRIIGKSSALLEIITGKGGALWERKNYGREWSYGRERDCEKEQEILREFWKRRKLWYKGET